MKKEEFKGKLSTLQQEVAKLKKELSEYYDVDFWTGPTDHGTKQENSDIQVMIDAINEDMFNITNDTELIWLQSARTC